MKGKKKWSYSMTRYWVILVCWCLFPLVLSKGFGVTLPGEIVMITALLYWIFVMVTAKYKEFSAKCYLERHHPFEARTAKLRSMPSAWPPDLERETFWDYFRKNPPPGDTEWREIQAQLDSFLIYIVVSFGSVGLFCFLYLILGIAK